MVDCGALDALVICLEEFDPGVKEAAAWALGYVAKHNTGNIALLKNDHLSQSKALEFVESSIIECKILFVIPKTTVSLYII